jgi:hypothetical protein
MVSSLYREPEERNKQIFINFMQTPPDDGVEYVKTCTVNGLKVA